MLLYIQPSSSAFRRRQALSESDDDEQYRKQTPSSPTRDTTAELQDIDGGVREDDDKMNGDNGSEDD